MSKDPQKSIFGALNERQKEAASHTEGPLLIIAGAGSGKTKTLTHRLAYIASKNKASDGSVLAITFTNKAADEMKKRTAALLRDIDTDTGCAPFIGTFHSFGALVLRDIAPLAGRTKGYSIYDEDDSAEVIKQTAKEHGLLRESVGAPALRAEIGNIKNELLALKTYSENASTTIERATLTLYPAYEQALEERNAFDFDDLIEKPVRLFEQHPEVLKRFQKKYRYILIDEYQDTNIAQYRLVQLLAGMHHNVCVVGDDAQAIYRWRGADFRNFLNFDKDWKNTKTVKLEQNYRSTKNILAAANGVIEKNNLQKKKRLWTDNETGVLVRVVEAADEMDEAFFAAETISEKISQGLLPSQCALLYRTNAQSRALEEALLTLRIPYRIIGAVKFYQRKEIKDLVAYLRCIDNPRDYTSLERIVAVPPRGISAKRLAATHYNLEKVPDLAALLSDLRAASHHKPITQLIMDMLDALRYKTYLAKHFPNPEERWENVMELVSLAQSFDATHAPTEKLRAFLETIHLMQGNDWPSRTGGLITHASLDSSDMVNLMTMHAAKGLEFHTVFVTGCEEGLIPHSRSLFNDEELEEERRLMYVAMTRAQKELFLTFSRARLLFGKKNRSVPSQFIYDIPSETTEFINTLGDSRAGDARADETHDDEEEWIEY